MATVKLAERKSREKASLRGSVAALQAFLKGPPALTPEEAREFDRIIQEERARGLTDFRNPLTRRRRLTTFWTRRHSATSSVRNPTQLPV